jgi:molecular chaperone GrpE
MKKHRTSDDHDLLDRDATDEGAYADGDAPLRAEPPNVSAAEPPPQQQGDAEQEAEQIESDMEALRREVSTMSDRHLRLAAEFDNYRKRVERERADAWGRAQSELAARLLDSLDDLERVLQHADGRTADALTEGVQLVERKLRQSLQSAGLEEVAAEGARFDPNSMEAVAMVAAESDAEDDVVSDVFQRGYRFKGNLIRPARVRVKKHGI